MKDTIASRAVRGGFAVVLAGTLAVPAYGIAADPRLLPQAHAAAGFPDDDVVPDAWYIEPIEWAVANGVIAGYDDGTFRPDEGITRAQVAVMLCRSAGEDLKEGDPYPENRTRWTDVADHVYYTHAMNWAEENGVFSGYGDDGTYVRPDATITREEVAAVVVRYARTFLGLNTSTAGLEWPAGTLDIDRISPYAVDSLLWTAAANVLSGIDNGDGTASLSPQSNTTRAQFARIAMSLVRDVAPTWPEHGLQIEDAVPEDLTPSSITILVRNASEENITPYCEFSLDLGIEWTDSPTFDGLEPASYHTVYVRLKGSDATPGEAYRYDFRTNEAYGTLPTPRSVQLDVADVAVTASAFAMNDSDITDDCEFGLVEGPEFLGENVVWQDSPTFQNLKPETDYRLYVRMKAEGGWLASSVNWADFTTHELRQGQMEVAEYGLVQVSARIALVSQDGDVVPVVVDCTPESAIDEASAAQIKENGAKLQAYLREMKSTDATEGSAETWPLDSVVGYKERTFNLLAKTGSHIEAYANELEYRALTDYDPGVPTAEQLAVSGRDSVDEWTFATTDGKTFSTRTEALKHCDEQNASSTEEEEPVAISSVKRVEKTTDADFAGTLPLETVYRVAGIDGNTVWCLTGDSILGKSEANGE